MTPDLEQMEAGPEMDRIIAEEVMKWTRYQDGTDPETYHGPIYAWRDEKGRRVAWATAWYDNDAWSPSTNIAHAWNVVDRMHTRGIGTTLMTPFAYTDEGLGPMETYSASMARRHPKGEQHGYGRDAKSAAVAICRAAVKAMVWQLYETEETPIEIPVEIPEKPPGNPSPGQETAAAKP